MEKVWRKVNQGLSNKSKTNSTTNLSNETAVCVGLGEGSTVAAGPGLMINTSTVTGRRLASSGQQSIIANSVPFRRRKKSRPRRNGERNGIQFLEAASNHTTEMALLPAPTHPLDSIPNSEKNRSIPLPPTPSQAGDLTSLRQRAVAKLRLFNFNLNWDLHMTQCKPCGPRSSGNVLTRRLCRNRRREDNELYRSNSFKFERFDRRDGSENVEVLRKHISVCDDYSLPIDFVKKHSSSFDPGFATNIPDNWNAPSPVSENILFIDPPGINTLQLEQIKLVDEYADPKDSRKHLKHRKSRKNRSSKCSGYVRRTYFVNSSPPDSSVPKSSAEDDNLSNKFSELNSPDSISEDLIRPLQPHKSPKRIPAPEISKRNPSPYYYSDLLKAKEENAQVEHHPRQSTASEPPQNTINTTFPLYKKSVSLDVPEIARETQISKRYSITEEGVRIIRCNSPSTTTSEDSDCSECQKRREWHVKALAVVRETCSIREVDSVQHHNTNPLSEIHSLAQKESSMPPHRLLGPAVCACTAPAINDETDEFFRPQSIFYVHQQGAHECVDCAINLTSEKLSETSFPNDEMSSGRSRQIYETAFDCKIARSDDDLDEVDRALLQANNRNQSGKVSDSDSLKTNQQQERKRTKGLKSQTNVNTNETAANLSQNIDRVKLDDQVDSLGESSAGRRYTPSPPSTAPLPVKFPGKHDRNKFLLNSMRSAPNLPASNTPHSRLKDLRHSINENHLEPEMASGSDAIIRESPYNPRSVILVSGRVIELRKSHRSRRRHGRDYSSTESMATSSSGESMESLRSSTSEGNRSTSSSSSRQSTSLSSHSSDSGRNISLPKRAPIVLHSKLHILSPISDKSSQEPASESSEVSHSKQSNSQKISQVEEHAKINSVDLNRPKGEQPMHDIAIKQQKRKIFPNKTLLHLADEMIGSDSGISLHSREDGRSTQSALQKIIPTKLNLTKDRAELNNQNSLALPQDLRDLPFDMPKLRRRKQLLQQDNCTSGSATSVDLGDLPFDMPKLRRRLRINLTTNSTESSGISQASSSYSVRDDRKQARIGETRWFSQFCGELKSIDLDKEQACVPNIFVIKSFMYHLKIADNAIFRQNLTLNLSETRSPNKFGSLDLKDATSRGLSLNIGNLGRSTTFEVIDATVPLDRQGWYHGAITRIEAETTLRPLTEGSFLVRNCESTKQDYSLSLKSAKGFMHMRIQRNDTGHYVLGQFSRPFDSVPDMIRHFCLNRLPVRGAEHMCLIDPVIVQLL